MALHHRTLAFAYRALASFLILLGIARVAGLWSATPTWSSFLYYTVLSNVLCLVWMVWSAIVTVRDAEAITVTMLIYLFVLAPALFTQPGAYQRCSSRRARSSRTTRCCGR